MTTYRIEALRPLYAEAIVKVEIQITKIKEKMNGDLYTALEWNAPSLMIYAAEERWLKGILAFCETLAENNAGTVDRAEVERMLDGRMRDMARGGTWSSNPVANLLRQEELSLLAKALEPFGDSLIAPFNRVDRAIERAARKAKEEAALWVIAQGKRWVGPKGLVNDRSRATTYSYAERPPLSTSPVANQRYEMLD